MSPWRSLKPLAAPLGCLGCASSVLMVEPPLALDDIAFETTVAPAHTPSTAAWASSVGPLLVLNTVAVNPIGSDHKKMCWLKFAP